MFGALFLLVSFDIAHGAKLALRDTTVSQNNRDSTLVKDLGQYNSLTTINPGVVYWLSGGVTHNVFGNLNNSGTIILSQTDYVKQYPYAAGLTSSWSHPSSTTNNLINYNSGFISVNDYGSTSGASYNWYLQSLDNRGGLQFCGRGEAHGSTFTINCVNDCNNTGVIDYEQYSNNYGEAMFWRNSVLTTTNMGPNIYNNGAFRLVNVTFHNLQNILGNGCIIVGSNAVLYLEDGSALFQNPSQGPVFPQQSIHFSDQNTGTIHMDIQVYRVNSNFGPQIYNFGAGRAIEFLETIKDTNGYSYANGVLTVNFISGNKVNLKIGSGYDASQFYVGRNSQKYNLYGYNAIFYRGSAPAQTVPDKCSVSVGLCADPASTVSASSTTTTTKSSTVAATTAATTTTTAKPVSSSSSNVSSSSKSASTMNPSGASTSSVSTSPASTKATVVSSSSSTSSKSSASTSTPSTKSPSPNSPSQSKTASSATTIANPSSISVTPTNPATSSTCGLTGYDKQNPVSSRNDWSGDYGTVEACTAYCGTAVGTSFAVGAGACLCYDAPVANNFGPNDASPYKFYDASCDLGSMSPSAGTPSISATAPSISTPSKSPTAPPISTTSVSKTSISVSLPPTSATTASGSGSPQPSGGNSGSACWTTTVTLYATAFPTGGSGMGTLTNATAASTTCGVAGYDKQNPQSDKNDFSGTYNTVETCRHFCGTTTGMSFAVSPANGACLCYPVPLTDNFNPVESSQYFFYDAGCSI